METTIHYPFIYFLYEPNQVFVYKIQALAYITIADVTEKGEWAGYELKPSEPFTAFHHERSSPKQGWSLLFEQNQLNHFVDIINDYIQQRKVETSTTAQMVHIVCSESAAGSLRVALAPPKYVIGFPDDLSIGPLWKLDEKRGQAFRHEWLMENINDGMDDFVNQNKFMNTIREIQNIPRHQPIYIWYGHNAEEQCGLRFILYLLRDRTNEIVLINTGEQNVINRQWNIEQYDKKQLPAEEHLLFQQQWESLAQTKEVFRLWLHQQIRAVPENYYDNLIMSTLGQVHQEQGSADFIQTGPFIYELVTRMDDPPNIFFLEYRIRYLAYSGVFELKGIPKSMRHYQVRLRQKTSLA
ncbi:DUF1835 domain-containing protein [Lysinibacillus cavernae]|uniref:DUF1835 domain-containing protein n=1 Tax=Lysinibacillus cavernae TaxID=2666135 RepID=UPI0012D8ADCD|nr:DUF1835 domain-containing protein [Lysinibacillus cavernae]